MKNLFGFLVLLCGNWVCSQRTPTISHIAQKPITDIGGTTKLTCSVLHAAEFPVLWLKIDKERVNDYIVLSSGNAMIIRDSKYSLRQDFNNFTLQITDVQKTDVGFYQCLVLLGVNNNITAEVELKVLRPPIIMSENSTRSLLLVKESQVVKLECYADGFPTPTVSWRRENNAILPTGNSIYRGNILEIPAFTKEYRGTYYCVAENDVGRGARRNIAVEVEFAPVISISKPRIGQALHYDTDLMCRIEAYPPPAIVWLNNGVPLSSDQHYKISHFGSSEPFTDSIIRVISIEKRQYGDYICKALNYLGTAEATVVLFETDIPVCPPACDQQSRMNNSTNSTTV